ncbi:MAG: MMPL family transporter [Xanthomonadales bacterium]|nr:MMPL family transporter [Gammaproteobacteria bacterium]MBT8052263.1 MMPL family transporter [Gammaproteobacteria bacterium]NNK52587.1 MMPL family transporter [Xanthomonadales bacterium]
MTTEATTRRLHNLATFLINYRFGIVGLFLLITIGMMFAMSNLKIETGFKKQLPLKHEYMQTFLQYEKEFGGANRVLVALVARDGNMFTPDFFESFETITNQVFFIPGVDRASVRSIFTPNVRFVEIVEDGFAGGNVIPSDFAPSPEMFERVRSNIVKSGEVGRLVSGDFSGAMVWANLLEEDPQSGSKLDYREVASQLEDIRSEFENDEFTVHIIGFAKIVGDISDGAQSVVWFFLVAFVVTAILLYLYSRSLWLTVLPLTCSFIAVIWQMGALSLMGYSLDPMNILTPFLIFAIGVSHGVQKISAWVVEKEFAGRTPDAWAQDGVTDVSEIPRRSPMHGSRETMKKLLAPGLIALLSDTIGFLTLLFINIRIIQELAITASIGVAVIILTNLLLLPVLLSWVHLHNPHKYRERLLTKAHELSGFWLFLTNSTEPRRAAAAIAVGVILFIIGFWLAQGMQIGDSEVGVPELRPEARYNQDAVLISEKFSLGVDLLTVVAETVPDACTENYQVMESIDRFAWNLSNVDGVQQVITLPKVAKVVNSGWNEGNVKWRILPRDNYVMRQALGGIETGTGLLNRDCSAMPILVFTEDHRAETIARVVDRVKELREDMNIGALDYRLENEALEELASGEEAVTTDALKFRLATGNVGVMAATNEDVAAAEKPMLALVFGAIIILCLITYRSIRGTICIVLPLVLVSTLAEALMAVYGIGLKVNTLPVVALGIGIGVDYGIYMYNRLDDLLRQGFSLREAFYRTLRLTGRAVIFTGFTLAAGVGTWMFSDLQFQVDMGLLLAFIFLANMVGAIILLPALVRWLVYPKHKRAQAEKPLQVEVEAGMNPAAD